MRKINVSKITDAVKELCLKANFELRSDVLAALKKALAKERSSLGAGILKDIIENARIAKEDSIAICQDTGMVAVFLEIGREVSLTGGNLERAVNEGVKRAYKGGCLRKSVVADPLLRKNTGTNTPCVIHTDIVEGNRMRIALSPKGFGSENKSKIMMFRPTATVEEIKKFVVDAVRDAGPSACPPLIIGIGIGGTFEKAAYLAKKALLRRIDIGNPKKHICRLERELLKEINSIGMGPMGLGGKTTALGINILDYPTHIAGLPVAVSISCHATRSKEVVL